MPEFERDLLLRQIRQLAQMVARIAFKARAEGRYESGLEQVRATLEGGLDLDYAMLRRIDAASVGLMVRDGEALRTLAWFAEVEGGLLEAAGDREAAASLRRRAIALYAECANRFAGEEAACREAARALADAAILPALAEEHRRWLEIPPATP